MTDILGPANAANAVTTRPTDTRVFGTPDTWFKPCTTAAAQDGTQLQAVFFNGLLANLRNLVRGNGLRLDGVTPVIPENANLDALLIESILQLIQRGQAVYGVDTGSADALVVTPTTAVAEYVAGMRFLVLKNPNVGANATPAPTINFGPGPLTVVQVDGVSPLGPGDLKKGAIFEVEADGAGNARLTSLLTISDVQAMIAADAGVIRVTDTAGASTAQALVGTASPAISAYSPSQVFLVTSGAAITAANPMLNVTGAGGTALGAKPIVKRDGTPLVAGSTPDIPAGVEFLVSLDPAGADFRALGLLPSDIPGLIAPASVPYTGQSLVNGGYYVVDVSQGTNFILPNPATVPVGWRVRIKAINTPTGYQTSQVSVAAGSAPQALNYGDSVHYPFYIIGNGEGFWFENTGTSYDVLTASQPGSFGLYASNPGGASSAGGTGSNIYMPISEVEPSGPGVAAAFNRSATVASLGVPVSGEYLIIAATSIVGQSSTVQQGTLYIADSTAINNNYYDIGAYANQSFPAYLSVPILVYLKQGSPLSAVINCPSGQNYVPSTCTFSVFLARR